MYKFIFFFSILFTLSSCFEERIDLDLNEGNEKLVIVAWISDLDEAQFVTLTKSANYLGEDTNEFVPDATVILSDEVRSYDLAYRGEGNYYLPDDWQARLGDLYRLDVLYDGVEYSAEHTMRPCPAIEELVYEIDESTDSTEWVVPTFAFQETPGEGDAYFGIDYLKGSPIGKYFIEGGFANDDFVDGEYFEDIRIGDRRYTKGDTIVVDLYSVGTATADFFGDVERERFRGSPFDPPPANIRTNIVGGGFGYFIVSGANREFLIVE